MSLRSYFIIMILATLACYLGFFAIVYFFDPFVGGLGILLLFYTSLFFALVGSLAIIGLTLRLFFTKEKLVFKKVTTSFRQAIWLSLLFLIILFLQKENLLIWRNLIFLILAFVILELFFMSYRVKANKRI